MTVVPVCRAAIIGVTGRMGCALLRAAAASPRMRVTGAIASPASLALGRDAGEVAGIGVINVPVTSDLPAALAAADVAIDFRQSAAVAANLAACRAAHRPLLLGTTGLGAALEGPLAAAALEIALLVAANTSLGGALLVELVRQAARALPEGFDIDILDRHHRHKQDAPSGTALALGSAAAAARGENARVAFASVRAGDLVGEHEVCFTGSGEALSLSHRVWDRAVFARGALAAALWLASRPAGRYEMRDILGLKTVT